MSTEPVCPSCASVNVYSDGNLWICPECAHEWSQFAAPESPTAIASVADDGLVRDANGTVLADGDDVTILKDLKVKGSSATLKSGTKAKNIRLIGDGNGHDIMCRIDGVGATNLKSEFVRKV